VAHQRNEDMPVAATASAKTTHDLRESLREVSGLVLERGGPGTALCDEVVDER
jgi:nicotinamidase-related amidase